MRKHFVILIVIFIPTVLFSQNLLKRGYIVNNSLDTIYGTIDIIESQKFCLFKHPDHSSAMKYSPNQIKSIKLNNGRYFVSKILLETKSLSRWFRDDTIFNTKTTLFFEYLLDGEVDIFYRNKRGFSHYYIENEENQLRELVFNKKIISINHKKYSYIDPKFRGFLKVYMYNSPSVSEKINKLEYIDQKILIELSEEYHHSVCADGKCINYTKDIPRFKLRK